MLKIRVIPTLLYKDHGLVKGVGFDSWRRVGTALPAIKVYCTREVDELIFVDIAASREGRHVNTEEVDQLADESFMPLTVGGGVCNVNDVKCLLRAGADKVTINTAAVELPSLISEAAALAGSQCIVASIDVKRGADGRGMVWIKSGSCQTGLEVVAWAREVEARGAGEILLTSIDQDGAMNGYDLELIRDVACAVSIPVIASGGAGNYEHMRMAVQDAGASAVAAASMFHFTEQTPLAAKTYLRQHGIPVRL
jgi:cyclase